LKEEKAKYLMCSRLEEVVNNPRHPTLIMSTLLIVVLTTPSFCGNAPDASQSDTVREEAQRATDNAIDITTKAGVTYKSCKIVRVESNGITYSHAKGVAKIPFPDLPDEYSDIYNYDPRQAEEYSRAVAKLQAGFIARQMKEAGQQIAASESQEEGEFTISAAASQVQSSDARGASFNFTISDSPGTFFPGRRFRIRHFHDQDWHRRQFPPF